MPLVMIIIEAIGALHIERESPQLLTVSRREEGCTRGIKLILTAKAVIHTCADILILHA